MRLFPGGGEAADGLVKQRFAHYGKRVGERRRGAGVKQGHGVRKPASAQKLQPPQLIDHQERPGRDGGRQLFAGGNCAR